MPVTLLHNTPLDIANQAIGKCWDKTTDKPEARMKRVGIKFKHASTLEHISYNFDIDGISRACLQELARHRISSFSVKSTRYTLKELKDGILNYDYFLVKTGNKYVDDANKKQLEDVVDLLNRGISNDIAKYALPEAYKTSLIWTVNMRSLRNFLTLRSSKDALWEIRDLANDIALAIPEDHRFMYEDIIDYE